ncbi:hypothetical protein Tco_0900570 [Tanacetum coccineum]
MGLCGPIGASKREEKGDQNDLPIRAKERTSLKLFCEKTSPKVLAYLDNQNTALLQTLDLMVHDLDRFFNEVEFVVDLDFIQRYSKSFVRHTFLQIRDVKRTMNSAQLFQEFKSLGNGSYFSNDLERSNIARVQFSPFAKMYHPFRW